MNLFKTLLSLSFCFFISFLNYITVAQCSPDTSISGLYSPDENEGLPTGDITIPYEAVITLNVPEDTSYLLFTAQVDRLELDGITGLPNGFDYDCFPDTNCIFPGGEYGCIRVFGVSDDNADAGTYDLVANFTFFLTQPSVSLPYDITGYEIVLDSVAVGIGEVKPTDGIFQVRPNPANHEAQLFFDLPLAGDYNIAVYSLLGELVFEQHGFGERGSSSLLFGNQLYEAGVYFITLKQGAYSRSTRFVVR